MSETPQKKDSEGCMFIAEIILSPQNLNDSKLSEMTPNESVCVKKSKVI